MESSQAKQWAAVPHFASSFELPIIFFSSSPLVQHKHTHTHTHARTPHDEHRQCGLHGQKDELDAFLNTAFQGNKTSAAYLVAPVESGQSTHLAGHVAAMADHHNAGPVFYIAEHHAESVAQFSRYQHFAGPDDVVESMFRHSDHMTEDDGQFSTGELVFCAYDTVSWPAVPRRCVFVVEVSLYCTTQAELFFSKLFGRCADPRNAHAVLFHAARLSKRTVAGMERSLPPGIDITVIEVPDTHARLTPETVAPDRFVEEARKAVAEAEGAVVALVDEDAGVELLPQDEADEVDSASQLRDYKRIEATMAKFGRDDARLRVGPELGFVSSCPHLGLLVSRRQRTMAAFDKTTSMLVEQTRVMGFHELVQEQAWIRRAVGDGNPRDVRHLVLDIDNMSHRERDARWAGGVDPTGPAYNGDLLETLLRLTSLRQDRPVERWPCRPAPDPDMMAEAARRLSMMDCICAPQPGLLQLTARGEATLKAFATLRQADRENKPRFETACLVALAGELTSPNARRVVLLMALITEFQDVLDVKQNDRIDQFASEYTFGVGLRHYARGWLWLALGFVLFQAGQLGDDGVLPADAPPSTRHGVKIVPAMANDILWALQDLAKRINEEAGGLDEAGLREVDWALLRALHVQCAFVEKDPPAGVEGVTELLTMRQASVNRKAEAVFGSWKDTRGAETDFAALYGLVDVPKSQKAPLPLSRLTYIPRDVCLEFGTDNGNSFPWCCETIYPLTR
ncbi:uncharacterized protein PG998_002911 [Apiospora kogelbergensis]|uniref:uncharacterized protein n=1 Tax=Apiospora kogelbergensis TaxID=1337665 RepID=UPI00312ED402